jgi:VCBS repeat-containing protein
MKVETLRLRPVLVLVTLLGMIGAMLVIAAGQEASAFPGANGKIAFEQASDIWTMNADGTGAGEIRADGVDPAWSADGSQIAYSDSSSAFNNIWKMSPDGTGALQVSSGNADFEPAWSPAGDWIVYRQLVTLAPLTGTATATDLTGITLTDAAPNPFLNVRVDDEVTNTTTGGKGTVTKIEGDVVTMTALAPLTTGWTVGDTYSISAERGRIYKMRSDGTGTAELLSTLATPTSYYNDYTPAWSPDGSTIAFSTDRNGNDDVLTIGISGDGAGFENLTPDIGLGDFDDVSWDPAWSPDGTMIAFSSAEHPTIVPGTPENIWVMNKNGSGKVNLTSAALSKDESATWSPDGGSIAFERTTAGVENLWVIPAAGGTETALTTGAPDKARPDWQATLGGVADGYSVDEGATLVVPPAGVLTNDVSLISDAGTMTAVKDTDPTNGALTFNADGSFTYVHDSSDTTTDSFRYHPVQGAATGSTTTVTITINPIDDPPSHTTGLVDPGQGKWYLYDENGNLETSFFYGNPGDFPIMGDWDGDGVETPGMYRQSDGFVYLRNSNTVGIANTRFFFGNPGDVPIAGDFNDDGFDTVSIYRPSNQTFYIINELGKNDGGLGPADFNYVFGNPGDKPFVGDFNGNGEETVGLHRESTGLVYYRNEHSTGNADNQFIFGDPGDRLIAGDWTGDGVFTPALFRPSNTTMFFKYTNSAGNADNQFVPSPANSTWLPVSGQR